MPLMQEITNEDQLFIGEISLAYEYFDPSDRQVMLVVSDPSLPWLRRNRPHFLRPGARLLLPNGVKVVLKRGSQKRAKLAIFNPKQLPVHAEKATWAKARAVAKAKAKTVEQSPTEAQKCATAGCFNTALGGQLCDDCLDERLPASRGPVKAREVLYAFRYGGEDLAVTRARLKLNRKPNSGLN